MEKKISQGGLQTKVLLSRRNGLSGSHSHNQMLSMTPGDHQGLGEWAPAPSQPSGVPSDHHTVFPHTSLCLSFAWDDEQHWWYLCLGNDGFKQRNTDDVKYLNWPTDSCGFPCPFPGVHGGEVSKHDGHFSPISAMSTAKTVKLKAVFSGHWPLQASIKDDELPNFRSSAWPKVVIDSQFGWTCCSSAESGSSTDLNG